MSTMQDIIDRLPTEWHCIKCKRDFPFLPDHEFAYAREMQTDANGRRSFLGDICRACYEAKT